MPRDRIFPLPHVSVEAVPSSHLSRAVRQRVTRRRTIQQDCNDTVDTINALSRGCSADVPQAHDDLDGSATQQEVLNYVHACHASLASCEERRADEALRALLRRDSAYSQGSQSKLAVYTPGNVSLPEPQEGNLSYAICSLLLP